MDEPVTSELELMLSALTLPRASLLPRLSQELERGRHLLQPEVLESSEILGDDTPDVDVHLVRVAAGLGVRLARLSLRIFSSSSPHFMTTISARPKGRVRMEVAEDRRGGGRGHRSQSAAPVDTFI